MYISPLAMTPQKLNVIGVRFKQKNENIKYKEHIFDMNNAIFHKIFIDSYGTDKYYDALQGLRLNKTHFRLVVYLDHDSITNLGLLMSKDHRYIYELMGDTVFAASLIKRIKQNIIFSFHDDYYYNTFGFLAQASVLIYSLEYYDNDIDTLSKDEFMRVQTDRLDSILTKTHLRYSRYGCPQIFDTDEYLLFNDSVIPIGIE